MGPMSGADPRVAAGTVTPMSPGVASPAVETAVRTGKTAQAHVVTPLLQTSPKASIEHVSAQAFDELHKLALTSDHEGFKAGQAKLSAEVVKLKDGKIEARNHWTSVAGRVLLKFLTLTVILAPVTLTLLSRSEAAHKKEIGQLGKLSSSIGTMSQEAAQEGARAEFQKNSTVHVRSPEGVKGELTTKMRSSPDVVVAGNLKVPAFINRDIHRARHIGVAINGGGKVSCEPSIIPHAQRGAVVDSFYGELLVKVRHSEASDQSAQNVAGSILALTTGNTLADEATHLTKPPTMCSNLPEHNLDPELRKGHPPPMTDDVIVHMDQEFCHQTRMGIFEVCDVLGGSKENVRYQVLTVERHIPMEVMRASQADLASGKVNMEGMTSVAAHSPSFATQAEALAYLKQASQIAKNGPLIK